LGAGADGWSAPLLGADVERVVSGAVGRRQRGVWSPGDRAPNPTRCRDRKGEADEALAAHKPDRPPTPDEEQAAEGNDLDEKVAERYREAIETGAEVKGEGRIP
jgi:hypothetical protein